MEVTCTIRMERKVRNTMNLKEQSYVCTLAKTGSLTQAAKLLFISQPALSLAISSLENHLGVRLFDRVGKQFVLTFAGELYVEKALPMLRLKEEFDTELIERMHGQNERLRVGIQNIRSHFLTPSVLPQITKMFPQTKIVWVEHNYEPLEQMLLNSKLDIFFCNCKSFRKEFEYIPILSDQVVFLTPGDHPLSAHALSRPEQSFPWLDLTLFQNERFILLGETQSLRRYSNQILKACNVSPKNVFYLKKVFNMISLINQGFGVGFSLVSYINWSHELNNVSVFSVVDPPVTATFYAIYKKGRHLTPAASALTQLIQQSLYRQVKGVCAVPSIHPEE